MEPREYLAQKGLEFKESGGEITIKCCPFCQDEKWHLCMDAKEGLYFCHKCNTRGNLKTLRRRFGDDMHDDYIQPAFKRKKLPRKPSQKEMERYQAALKRDPEAMQYRESRGFTQETVDRFKLGLMQDNQGKWLSIPHFENGELANIKFRSLPPTKKVFKRVRGCRSILFNGNILKNKPGSVTITEGELDAITLLQAGFQNVVSGTTGAGAFDPQWIDQLKDMQKIFIAYDADQKGQEGAKSLAKRLGYNRCFNVELPEGRDVNDFFVNGGSSDGFRILLKKASRFNLPGVIEFPETFDLLRQELNRTDEGLITPWRDVNRLIGGFKSGDLIILAAPPKTGKTTFALNISVNLSKQAVPSLFFCLEMRPERLLQKVIQAEFLQEQMSEELIRKAEKRLEGIPLYFGHLFRKKPLDDLIELIREAIKRYDLKFVLFDNIHFLIRSYTNVNEELGQAVQAFKLLAEEMEIPVLVVAQPRKKDPRSKQSIMTADDIKYSNAIHADCDQMLILHRQRNESKVGKMDEAMVELQEEAFSPVTLLRVEAHRYGPGGEALLYFHGKYSRFDPYAGPQQEPLATESPNETNSKEVDEVVI